MLPRSFFAPGRRRRLRRRMEKKAGSEYTKTMTIDGRGQKIEDTLRRLKELFSREPNAEQKLEVILGSREDMQKTAAFAAMSGYDAKPEEKQGIYRVMVRGTSCGCV